MRLFYFWTFGIKGTPLTPICRQSGHKGTLYPLPQEPKNVPKIGEQKEDFPITPQVVEQIAHDIFSIPWGHHRFLIDRFQNYPSSTQQAPNKLNGEFGEKFGEKFGERFGE